jgi:hypothetical protein
MTTLTSWQYGGWLGIAGAGRWVLTDAAPDDPIVATTRTLVAAGEELHQIVAAFTGRPDLMYALVGTAGDVTQVVLRGPVQVELATPGETRVYRGAPDGGDWAGHVVAVPVLSIGLSAGPATHPRLALDEPWLADREPGWPAPETEHHPASTDADPSRADRTPSVNDAPSLAGWTPSVDDAPSRADRTPDVDAPPSRPAIRGLISDVSWAGEAPAPAPVAPEMPRSAPPVPDAPRTADDHGWFSAVVGGAEERLDITIWRPIADTSVMTAGSTVPAVICVAGHPNPPAAVSCRLCAQPVPPQAAVVIPRPTLGALRMSTGDAIRLDHGVIFGRDPGTPDANRRDQPFFVRLTDREISRRHLEVVLDGWVVVVVDLNSSNGSAVTPPGGAPEVIPGGERRRLVPGTVVHLSDTISFVFEVRE